jgi:dTDP-4-amino-4,6-dideoxygalactose transaminase
MRGLFMRPSLYWVPASLPFLGLGQSIYDPNFAIGPMSKFQEQLASRLLPGLDGLVAVRQRNAGRLRRALSELPGLSIVMPAVDQGENGCLRLPILVKDSRRRNRMLRELQREGLGTTCGYPLPLSNLPELRSKLMGSADQFPIARQISEQLITLPTHPDVTDNDMDRMVEVLRRCIQKPL